MNLVAGVSPLPPPDDKTSQEHIQNSLAVGPRSFGLMNTRWTLDLLHHACPWLTKLTRSGRSRLLKRLGFSFQRARAYFHSPDPLYQPKAQYLKSAIEQSLKKGIPLVFWDAMAVHLDETSQTKVWGAKNQKGPKLEIGLIRKPKPSMQLRVLGGLRADTGQVLVTHPRKINTKTVLSFLKQTLNWARCSRLFVAVDNHPIHFHKDILGQLERQDWPFAYKVPPSWGSSEVAAKHNGSLPIQLVPLPTYSPWLNPIEKLWRKARQDVLHAHDCLGQPSKLTALLQAFFNQFTQPSPQLLRYVGLYPD